MTQEETKAALLQILRQMTSIASELQAYAGELTELQMAVIRERHLKSTPQTIGNIVALPGVSLQAARHAQQRQRRKEPR
jgi:hypothetical protein